MQYRFFWDNSDKVEKQTFQNEGWLDKKIKKDKAVKN